MKKKYYLQVNKEGFITDAIEYKYADYVEFETDEPLPTYIMGGWFKLEDGVIMEYKELKPKGNNEDIDILKSKIEHLELTLDVIMSEVIPSLLG